MGVGRNVVWLRWARCAPTAFVVDAVSPRVPMGGAAFAFASAAAIPVFVASPWQAAQEPAGCAAVGSATSPSTCVAAFTVVVEYPVPWQSAQAASCGCGAAGGLPWQAVQASAPAAVQAGVAAAPAPPVKLPWQYVDAQVSDGVA